MREIKAVWNVSFKVDVIMTEEKPTDEMVKYSPCANFIEGCLLDLRDSHGLVCRGIKVKAGEVISIKEKKMKTKYKYIHFEKSLSGVKNIWHILTNRENDFLGRIIYFNRWQQYVLDSELGSIFSQDCLADIIDFIKQLEEK